MAHQRQDSTGSAYDPSAAAAAHYQHQMQLQQQHHQQQQYPMMHQQQQHDPTVPSSHQPPMQHAHMQLLHSFWMNQMHDIENVPQDFKIHHLPLARIKKVMKTDEDVKMISAEAPMIFDKGCEIFITELTIRAWIHAEENKRRTLQRSDIAAAISKTDMFDFLIDIVPREEFKAAKEAKESSASGHGKSASGGGGIEHRHSQESFPPMGGVGGPAAAGGGSGGPIGLEGYGYPYGMIANGQFSMGPGGGGEGMDPYQQQLQLQYMRAQMAQQQQQQQHGNPQQQRYDFQQHMSHEQQSSDDGSQQLPPEGW
ncbi:hypothetical protein BGZ97_003190 [Linnemannia gamsii]|uniref:Core Histone H2A/H2B/H3 domain-containing protein n=1 Tax=Linnemannia gamsii TaxID=64522 RepID=A0A9P6QW18_9FUNG|nr:hypothetical protein BGZ97_003190 [Linnemannia gamsii]